MDTKGGISLFIRVNVNKVLKILRHIIFKVCLRLKCIIMDNLS